MKNIIKTKISEFICEKNNTYKEIEFVCHNSDSTTSTNIINQKRLYNDLKNLEIKSDFKIKPYMQDFSEDGLIQLSLAVIILDKQNEKELEKEIMKLAKNNNVEFDLYNDRSEYEIDRYH